MTLQEMIDKKTSLIKEARELNDATIKEVRDFTAEERTKYDRILSDVQKLQDSIAAEKRRLNLQGIQTELPVSKEGEGGPDAANVARSAEDSIEKRRYKAFQDYLAKREVRTAATNTGEPLLSIDDSLGGGGVWAPERFVGELLKEIDKQVKLLSLVRIIPLSKTSSIGIPEETADATDALWTSEIPTSQAKESTWAFGKRELNCFRLAKEILISNKMFLSSITGIDELVREKLSTVISRTIEKAILFGTGEGQPLGVFTVKKAATASEAAITKDGLPSTCDVETEAATGIDANCLIDAKMKLRPGYRSSAYWVFHSDMLNQILKIKDSDGQYIWRAGLTLGEPDRLLGLPVIESEFAPNTIAAGKFAGILGNFSYYWMTRLQSVSIKVLSEIYAEKNMTAYLADTYMDGQATLAAAFRRIKFKS